MCRQICECVHRHYWLKSILLQELEIQTSHQLQLRRAFQLAVCYISAVVEICKSVWRFVCMPQ